MRLCRYDWLSTVEAVARRAEQERALHEIIERYSPPPMLETYLPYILGMPENTCHAYCTYHAYCINHAYCIYHAYCIHLYIPSIHTRHACTYFPYVMDVPEFTLLPHLLESCLECLSVTAGLSKFSLRPPRSLPGNREHLLRFLTDLLILTARNFLLICDARNSCARCNFRLPNQNDRYLNDYRCD